MTEQQTLPGIPVDRRRELRAQLDLAEKDAREFARQKREPLEGPIAEHARVVLALLSRIPETPPEIIVALNACIEADAKLLAAKEDAGRIAAEIARTEGNAAD